MRATLPLLFALACHTSGVDTPADTDVAGTDPPAAPTRVFTFAVIADPHVTSEGDRAERLRGAAAWLDREAGARGIELLLIAGDIAWDDGFPATLQAFETLSIPWIPMVGDNEVQVGSEQAYHDALAPQYAVLAATMPGWVRLPMPIADPEIGRDAWYQCFSFTWKGVTFLGLDIASRVIHRVHGEFADLHDVPGGTLPFMLDRLAALPAGGPREDVVMLTHNPLLWTLGGLDPDEQEHLLDVLTPYDDRVSLALGGHLHVDEVFPEVSPVTYDVVITDALWDDAPSIRVVDVWSDGRAFTYEHEVLVAE